MRKNDKEIKEVVMKRDLTKHSPTKISINPEELYVDIVFMARKSGYPDECLLYYKVKFQKKKQ